MCSIVYDLQGRHRLEWPHDRDDNHVELLPLFMGHQLEWPLGRGDNNFGLLPVLSVDGDGCMQMVVTIYI